MIKAKAIKDLNNGNDLSISKDEECFITDVWLNNTSNDIYCKIAKNNKEMITSVCNLKWKE